MSYHQEFKGKVVIVTGATSGIGKEAAFALAEVGASVVLAGRRAEEGRIAVKGIRKTGGVASFYQADVTKEEEIKGLVQFTIETYGRLDMAFNNAGAYSAGSVVDVTEEEFHRIFNLNVWGVLACMKHEIAAMLKTGGGSIINCSSVVGQKAFPNSSIYVASKHAVEGLTKSAALEFATQGIRINSLAPGPFPTEIAGKVIPEEVIKTFEVIIPLHRLGRTKELIPAILFLLSPSNSFVVGATVAVDGGMLA